METLKKLTLAALSTFVAVNAANLDETAEIQPVESFSLELNQHEAQSHKYSHIFDRSLNKRSSDKYLDLVTSLLQYVSGERESTLEFEKSVESKILRT